MPDEFKTSSGIVLERFYGPESAPDSASVGAPASYPFTRGIQKDMYRGRLWTMRQYAGFGTAQETNRRFRWLLSQGQTGLSTAFDLPTQLGLDADDAKAKGEVGRVGVHVGSLADMRALFEEIPLGKVSTSLTINATASVLLALYIAVAEEQGVSPESLRGTLQNDILKEFIARGTYIFPVKESLRLAADTMEYSLSKLPNFNPISISGYHIREAGSDAVQEVAFTFANAEVYLKALTGRGVSADKAASRLAFFFGCHNTFLEEVAKFRAARKVWARLMRENYGAKDPKAQALRFHVQTCGSTLTRQQPKNNAVRVALQAMAAALGGAQSLHTNSYDEALGLPTAEAAQLALRTQQILAHETGVPDAVDPLGGAYAVESLTAQLERRVWEKIEDIRAKGGMTELLAKQAVQAEIQERAYQDQLDVESGARKVVGVNCYQFEDRAAKTKTMKVSASLEAAQARRLKQFKARRDGAKAQASLTRLAEAARGSGGVFPMILDCVRSRATLGEICASLRRTWGESHGG